VRLVVDTNVFVSGVFFSGPPYDILDAWRRGRIKLVVSPEIIEEYRRTGEELARRFSKVDLTPWLELVAVRAILVAARPLAQQVCSDPDDDKFLACAATGGTKFIATGDKALLKVSGYQGIAVLRPRDFVDQYLKKRD
jgi:putative PIN family toxin of toxin-antitoxin system